MPRKTRPIRIHIPRLFIHLAVISVVLSWVPIVLLVEYRTRFHTEPPIHFIQDMDAQPKLTAQAEFDAFNDRRAMRPRLAGTVARGELREDDHFYRGFVAMDDDAELAEGQEPQWYAGYPAAITVDSALLERGHERFNIYCAPCHGIGGRGNGMVHQRAVQIGATATGWVQPVNLVGRDAATGKNPYGDELYPDGKLFNTITHGARTMRGYASQIDPADRWAIIAHVRALQLAADAPAEMMPDRPVADDDNDTTKTPAPRADAGAN